ncbi:MAG: dipeptidase [Bacillota bacterium]
MNTAKFAALDLHSDILTDVYRRRAAGERRIIASRFLPTLQLGGVCAICCSIWIEPRYRRNGVGYVMKVLNCLAAEIRETGAKIELCRTTQELEATVSAGKLAILLSIEGLGAARGLPALLDLLCMIGVQMVSLTWNERNGLAAGVGCKAPVGLTRAGKHTIRELGNLGILLDVSHLNERAFWDAMDEARGPVLASHSNCKSLCDVDRNLNDDQIRAIARSGGIIGVNAWPEFVDPREPTIERFVDHIEHIASLVGSSRVSLGLDFCDYLSGDLTSGVVKQTKGLEDHSKLSHLAELLLKRGFHEEEVRGIMFSNALELLRSRMG